MTAAGLDPGHDARGAHPASAQVVAAATASVTIAMLPAFLAGSQSVFIRRELGFGETELGAALAVFSLCGAVASVPAGRLGERLGAGRAMAVAAVASATSLFGVAVAARTWGVLVAFLGVGGIAIAFAGPAANLALARGVRRDRQGLAFGLKQAAGPLATLIAGAMVPTIGLTLGWRWAYGLSGVAALAFVAFVACVPRTRGGRPHRPTATTVAVARTPSLVLLAAAAAFGVGGANALTAFFVESAVAVGVGPGLAGGLLALGSTSGIAARVFYGWAADRWDRPHLRTVQWLLVAGALGYALLATEPVPAGLAVATVVAFSCGWGWPGLLMLAVVRHSATAPAAASGIITAGMSAGGIVGPLGFGILLERFSYPVAWTTTGAAVLCAAVLVGVARATLRHDLRLPPVAPRPPGDAAAPIGEP